MSYVHVSFDTVGRFVPRIPGERADGEDAAIPRICVTDSVLSSLNAVPAAGNVLENTRKINMPLVVHAYYLTPKEGSVMKPADISGYVPDAMLTGEHWLTAEPEKVTRRDYMVSCFFTRDGTDVNGKKVISILSAKLVRCRNTDNWETFFHTVCGRIPPNALEYVSKNDILFRTFANNLDDKMLEGISAYKGPAPQPGRTDK